MFADRKARPKNVRTRKTGPKNVPTEKRSIIPDDQKIDTRNFITFDQIFGKG